MLHLFFRLDVEGAGPETLNAVLKESGGASHGLLASVWIEDLICRPRQLPWQARITFDGFPALPLLIPIIPGKRPNSVALLACTDDAANLVSKTQLLQQHFYTSKSFLAPATGISVDIW